MYQRLVPWVHMADTSSPLPPSGAHPGPPADVPEQIMFAAGDKVKISLDQEAFRGMQEGHGGWNEKMNQVCVLGEGG